MKAKVELTAAAVKTVIEERKPSSMTQLAHEFGYRGSVSSTLTRKFRALVPDIDTMLKGATAAAKGADGKAVVAKGKAAAGKRKAKIASSAAKPAAEADGKWPHAGKSPFRPGSSYDTCYSILAAHKEGLTREKLVELLATAMGKDAKRAAFDAQVLLSARGNDEPGLSRNDGPRHRSCRPGFWVKRNNSHVQLVVD